MSESRKGRIPWNKGLVGVCQAWNKGKKHTQQHIENSRKANIGRKDSMETRLKKSLAGMGRKPSKEAIEKSRKSRLGSKASIETRKRLSESHKGIIPSKESTIKRSASLKKTWALRIREKHLKNNQLNLDL